MMLYLNTDFYLYYRMGELEPWIDENFVRSVWFGMGEQVNVKMIRDKFSGYDTGKPFNQFINV